jgi:BirA family biotin operon repressor/biotin-[acetyl-CoA-carboxylase] ligase
MTADGDRAALDEAALRSVVLGPAGWRTLDVVAETGSTNADLIARTAAGEDVAWSALIAENQTAGRGRNGRSWSATPRAQITMSVGVPADGLPPAAWGWVPLVTGLAVVDAVARVTGVEVGLKWPNDVLASDGRKLAGILAEVASPGSTIVVGVGLNVSQAVDELPEPTAVSLTVLGAEAPDRGELIAALLDELRRRVGELTAAGGSDDALIADYRAKSLTISSRVRATLPGEKQVVGDAVSIDDQGRLRIDTGADVTVVSAGDIVHLRPA